MGQIKLTARQEKVYAIEKEQKDLEEYDKFFDNLKEGQTLIEYGVYDDFDVDVVSWNKEKGKIVGKYLAGGTKHVKTFDYWELNLEPRNMFW